MGSVLAISAYAVYALFVGRFLGHLIFWLRAAEPGPGGRAWGLLAGLRLTAAACIDLTFFRRLFISNKPLWCGSWTFHAAFILVVLRHLRYFLDPVPACISNVQPFGLVAGYILPAAVCFVLLQRLCARKNRYVSAGNYLLLTVIAAVSASGLCLRLFFEPDLVAIKGFVMGIVTFSLAPLPNDTVFALHFGSVLLLLAVVPLHLIAAPLVTLDARRREDELGTVMHER